MKAPLDETAKKLLADVNNAKQLMTALIVNSFNHSTQHIKIEGKNYKLEKLS